MVREIRLDVTGDNIHASRKKAGIMGEGNVTDLVVSFDESWDGYAKKITWWNALEKDPVERTLTADLLVDLTNDTRIYKTTVPPEPLAMEGECTLVIDGYAEGKRARSVAVRLEVEYAPDGETAGEPADPTPTQAEQLQAQIDTILENMSGYASIASGKASEAADSAASAKASASAAKASESAAQESETAAKTSQEAAKTSETNAKASETAAKSAETEAKAARKAIEDMTVSVTALEAGSAAEVDKTESGGVVHMAFGIPRGEKGDRGETGPQGPEGPQGIQGTKGDTGPQGPAGKDGTSLYIEDTYTTLATLRNAIPGGNKMMYMVEEDQECYIWSEHANDWVSAGKLQGPEGPQGPQGEQGVQGPQGAIGPEGPQGPAGVSGQDGKSAYQTAVEGGYSGTETAFVEALANVPGHIADTTKHITADERAAWNGKAAGTHASQHASGGSDSITPASIGAMDAAQYVKFISKAQSVRSTTGWYRVLCNTVTSYANTVLVNFRHTYNVVGPQSLTALVVLDAYIPRINILGCTSYGNTVTIPKLRLVKGADGYMYLDYYYGVSGENTVTVSALNFYYGTPATIVDFTPVDEIPSGETILLTQEVNAIPNGNMVTNGSQLYTYSTTDLTAGTSSLTTGRMYLVYE